MIKDRFYYIIIIVALLAFIGIAVNIWQRST
jgi:hypothetical protein